MVWSSSPDSGSFFSSPCLTPSLPSGPVPSLQSHKTLLFSRLYICSFQGTIFCYSSINGWTIWKYNVNKPIFSSPVYTEDLVCVGCADGNMYALNLQGELVSCEIRCSTNKTTQYDVIDYLIYIFLERCKPLLYIWKCNMFQQTL